MPTYNNKGIDFAGESFLSGLNDTLRPADLSIDLKLPFNNVQSRQPSSTGTSLYSTDFAQHDLNPPDTMVGNVGLVRSKNPGWVERQVRRFGPMLGRKLCTLGTTPGLMYYKSF